MRGKSKRCDNQARGTVGGKVRSVDDSARKGLPTIHSSRGQCSIPKPSCRKITRGDSLADIFSDIPPHSSERMGDIEIRFVPDFDGVQDNSRIRSSPSRRKGLPNSLRLRDRIVNIVRSKIDTPNHVRSYI